MWKKKLNCFFGIGVLVAMIVWCQIAIYMTHLFFGIKFHADFFDLCLYLVGKDNPFYFAVIFLLNTLIAYSTLVTLIGFFEYLVHSKRMRVQIRLIRNTEMTEEVRQSFEDQDITVINHKKVLAFTSGLRHPQIVLSTGLIDLLERFELEAVIKHEMSHKTNHDPMKLFILRLITRSFWFIPLTKVLYKNYKIICELSADEFAIKITGSQLGISTALLKLINNVFHDNPISVHFSNESVNYRLQYLIDPDQSLPLRVDSISLISSVLVILIGMVLVTVV